MVAAEISGPAHWKETPPCLCCSQLSTDIGNQQKQEKGTFKMCPFWGTKCQLEDYHTLPLVNKHTIPSEN